MKNRIAYIYSQVRIYDTNVVKHDDFSFCKTDCTENINFFQIHTLMASTYEHAFTEGLQSPRFREFSHFFLQARLI